MLVLQLPKSHNDFSLSTVNIMIFTTPQSGPCYVLLGLIPSTVWEDLSISKEDVLF